MRGTGGGCPSSDFKRRRASRQAVIRKGKGIEPRNSVSLGGTTRCNSWEVTMSNSENWLATLTSPGSETTACLTRRFHGNPGGPALLPGSWEYARRSEEERTANQSRRESDRFVVPTKAGNSAGGKETTSGTAE